MAKRRNVPAGQTATAYAAITGVVSQQPRSDYSHALRTQTCRLTLEVGEADYHAIGRGKTADQLATFRPGSVVKVEGPLVLDEWETGDSKRSRVVLHVERFEELWKPGPRLETER